MFVNIIVAMVITMPFLISVVILLSVLISIARDI